MAKSGAGEAKHRLPLTRPQRRILDDYLVVERVPFTSEAYHDMQIFIVKVAISTEPGFRVEIDNVHDQRISFPESDGVAIRLGILVRIVLRADRDDLESVYRVLFSFLRIHEVLGSRRGHDLR